MAAAAIGFRMGSIQGGSKK